MREQPTSVGMERKLAAIFSADVVGYSRPMGDAVLERHIAALRKAGLK
jgi:hypothetical protein